MVLDQQSLQKCILECEGNLWMNSKNNLDWIKKEGTMHPDFLHLEDNYHSSIDILSILNEDGEIVEGDEVLGVL